MTRVALFTKTFLEPTHYAIAAVLRELRDYEFVVFAKQEAHRFDLPNVSRVVVTREVSPTELQASGCQWVHAIFDGDIGLRAAGAARIARLPYILSFHGGFDTKAKIFDPLYREITRSAAQDAARVTVVSKADTRRLGEIGVTRPVDIVPVPFDGSLLPPARREPGRLVAIGRLVEKKGFDLAILALRELPASYTLTVVGDGPRREEWTRLAVEEGIASRVHWLGELRLERCLSVLTTAWALIHPAGVACDGNAEGTPQVILWAQAAGIPVVCCNSGDVGELVDSGAAGVQVLARDPGLLAAAIRDLEIPERTAELITHAAARVSRHSLDLVVAQWRAIYRDLEKRTGPSTG